MKKLFTLLFFSGIFMISHAQFSIGTTTITFNDPLRAGGFGSGGGAGRQIQCEIYYPANSVGTGVAVANGKFPVIVFGHGFVMAWDAYQNIWQELVPKGYIMVFPRTEGGTSPSHEDFGLDLRQVEEKMVLQGTTVGSFFYEKLNNRNAIMGHSMGGGATILAGASNSSIKTIIGLAPAETTPSAISAASNVTVPALILSGGQDGVTPAADHHSPIYNNLNSNCKTFVNIVGGAHCYFANSNFNCDLGEGFASTGILITRAQQQTIMNSLINPWLDFYLKGNCDGFNNFETSLSQSGITHLRTCNYTPFSISGVVTHEDLGLDGMIDLTLNDGLAPFSFDWSNGQSSKDIIYLAGGTYTVTVTDAFCSKDASFIVNPIGGGSSSILENEFYSFHVYPNPANGNVTIQLNNESIEEINLLIFDVTGKLVLQTIIPINTKEFLLDLNGIENGIYFIQLNNSEKALKTIRLVVSVE